MNNKQINVNIDLKTTTAVESSTGGQIFQEGIIFRKVSRFVTGTNEDSIISVPCFFDSTTGEVLVELLPKELRAEYEEYNLKMK
jgi:hypothetical protein